MEHRIGKQLTQAREALGLIVEDVAHRTHIPAPAVRQLESEDYSHFPNNVYAKGFLRIYGKFLAVDPEDYIEERDGQLIDREDEIAFLEGLAIGPEFQDLETAKPNRKIPSGVATTAVVLLLGIPTAILVNKLLAGSTDDDTGSGSSALIEPAIPDPVPEDPVVEPIVEPVVGPAGVLGAEGEPSPPIGVSLPAITDPSAPAPRATLPEEEPLDSTTKIDDLDPDPAALAAESSDDDGIPTGIPVSSLED